MTKRKGKRRRSRANQQTKIKRKRSNKKITVIPPRAITKRSLTDLAKQINAEHLKIVSALRTGLRHAITAGSLLIAAKTKLKHGQWLPWLRAKCQISERTAQLYMQLADHAPEIESKCEIVADLTVREAIALIAKTDESEAESLAQQQPDASEADNNTPAAVTAAPASDQINQPRTVLDVHQDARPAREMSDNAKWRYNLNQAGHYLLHIPHTPITSYLHRDVRYTAEQWDEIAEFLKKLGAAMRNTVAALDAAMEEDKTLAGGRE
jgi:hypothetical protein